MNVMWYDGALRDSDDIAVLPFTHALPTCSTASRARP